MKLSIEIDDNQLNERICDLVVNDAVKTIEDEMLGDSRYSFLRRMYKENVQENVRKLIKDRADEIIDKAIKEASLIIARKAIPKMLEKEIG